MSRIGKRIITIPESVNIEQIDNKLTVKGPKGTLDLEILDNVKVIINGQELTVEKIKKDKFAREMHGTTNANINNMIIGVTEGYKKALEIRGVGYRFTLKGNVLTIAAGYSHPVNLEIPQDLTITQVSNTEIVVEGIDKCKVGKFSAEIRKVREPEPYKGKGIRYKGEYVRQKEGKKASK